MPSTTHGLFKNVYWMHHGDRLRGVRWARQSSSSSSSCFNDLAQRASSKYQIYISRSLDPFRNLSIEHFLLQNTPSDSTVLFLYVNRPCVVIGRNQNPWVEVNLPLLHSNERKIRQGNGHVRTVSEPSISLVRRRSGGGTVFHDAGNVNFCVICPTAGFHRDKHAEMVAAALRRLGVSTAKVNDRHDIVMDPAMKNSGRHLGDDCNPDITAEPVRAGRFLKISGSAYKLTRARSLHHGTCLLRSPNLDLIPLVLRSPAKPYITARGVESVRSPVGNANISPGAFAEAVVRGFGELYGIQDDGLRLIFQERRLHDGKDWVGGFVEEVETCLPDIKQGMEELMSPEWTYLQTPQFIFSSHATHESKERRKHDAPFSASVHLTVRHGAILSSIVSNSAHHTNTDAETALLHETLHGRRLHEIDDWDAPLIQSGSFQDHEPVRRLFNWLNSILGTKKGMQYLPGRSSVDPAVLGRMDELDRELNVRMDRLEQRMDQSTFDAGTSWL